MNPVDRRNLPNVDLAARLVVAAVIAAFLYWAQFVLIPLCLALLIAFILNPAVRALRRWRLPQAVAVMVTVGAFSLVIGGLAWLIGGQIASFTEQLPRYRANIVAKVSQARDSMRGGTIEKLQTTLNSVAEEVQATPPSGAVPPEPGAGQPPATPVSPAPPPAAPAANPAQPPPALPPSIGGWPDLATVSSLGPILGPLSTAALVVLLVVLMLLQWADLRSRMLGLLSENMTGTTLALDDAGRRIGRYLTLQLAYNATFGVVSGLILWGLGVPYPALWGLAAAVFRYVPYAGPLAAAALPIFVSIVTSEGWSQVVAVAAAFVVLEIVSNNFVEPWLYGSHLGISEIGIILASVAWTFLWGPAGLVLATPLTVCLVVLGTHVPRLSFFARLLGDEAILSPYRRLFQRLLANDLLEAKELAHHYAVEHGTAAFVDEMALPVFALARREEAAGRMREPVARTLLAQLAPLLDEIMKGEHVPSATDALPADPAGDRSPLTALRPVPVAVWSVCSFSDAAVPLLLNALKEAPAEVKTATSRDLIGETLQQMEQDGWQPAFICVAYLQAEEFDRVHGLVKRLRLAWPAAPLLVARWGGDGVSAEEKSRLSQAGVTAFAASLAETKAWLVPHLLNVAQTVSAGQPGA